MEYMPVSEVYNMDCMDYMREIPDGFFHLAVVDPPYGLSPKSTRGSGKLKNRTLNRGDMRWDVRPPAEYFDELFRVSRNQVIWGGNYFYLPPTRCFVCWDKKQAWENFSQCEMAWTSFDRPAKLVSVSNRGGRKGQGENPPHAEAGGVVRLSVPDICRRRIPDSRHPSGKRKQPHCGVEDGA